MKPCLLWIKNTEPLRRTTTPNGKRYAKKLAPLIKKLDQLKNGIEPELIKKYYDLRKNRKMPAFVEYADGNCAGCGMQISIEVGPKLHKKGIMPNAPNAEESYICHKNINYIYTHLNNIKISFPQKTHLTDKKRFLPLF